MIFGRWRPVAFFSAGPYDVRTTIVDALMALKDGARRLLVIIPGNRRSGLSFASSR
jgi:hypothetical protein